MLTLSFLTSDAVMRQSKVVVVLTVFLVAQCCILVLFHTGVRKDFESSPEVQVVQHQRTGKRWEQRVRAHFPCKKKNTNGTRFPSREEFAALNLESSLDFSMTARALQEAITQDCADKECHQTRVTREAYTASLEPGCVQQTMQGLSVLLAAVIHPQAEESLRLLDRNLPNRVLSLAHFLLFEICTWLPKAGSSIPTKWPTRLADLLPEVMRPTKDIGIVTCVSHDADFTEVLRLLDASRSSVRQQIPNAEELSFEIFSQRDLGQRQKRGMKAVLKGFDVEIRSLSALYGTDVAAMVPCQPLAAMASRSNRQLFLEFGFLLHQPPAHFFARCSAFVQTGAAFFRNVPLTLDSEPAAASKPRRSRRRLPLALANWKLLARHTGGASPKFLERSMVLNRSRVDLGIFGTVSLTHVLAQSIPPRKFAPMAPELWWMGFDMMDVAYGFSPFYVGTATPVHQHVAELERRSLGGSQAGDVVVCGKPTYFDDVGDVLFWMGDATFPGCAAFPLQLSEDTEIWPRSSIVNFLLAREAVEETSEDAVGLSRIERVANCGSCLRVASPWCLVRTQLSPRKHRVRDKPLVAAVKSPRFPFVQQFRALTLDTVTPTLAADTSTAQLERLSLALEEAVASDCLVADCTILTLNSSSFRAPRTAAALGSTMRGLSKLISTITSPGLYEHLVKRDAKLPHRVATLTRKLVLATCDWLPHDATGAPTPAEWPTQPMDLLPAALQPGKDSEGGLERGIVTCAGSRQLNHLLTVFSTIREHWLSEMPIEVIYFDESDLRSEHRALLKAKFAKVYFSSLESMFPTLMSRKFLSGWDCKVFAALSTRFKQAALLDADILLVRPPELFFQLRGFVERGAAFLRDRPLYAHPDMREFTPWHLLQSVHPKTLKSLSHPQPFMDELLHIQDSSLVVVDRPRVILGLLGTASLLGHDAVRVETQEVVLGDKELFWIGFEMMGVDYRFSKWLAGSIGNVEIAAADQVYTPPPTPARPSWKMRRYTDFIASITQTKEVLLRQKMGGDGWVPKFCPEIRWEKLRKHCGHMVQFNDAGDILYWNGGVGMCDHREKGFSWRNLLVPHSFARVSAERAPRCLGPHFQFVNECGWCLFLGKAHARAVEKLSDFDNEHIQAAVKIAHKLATEWGT